MVWGQKQGVGDWAERLNRNDPKLTSLTVLRFRSFAHEDVAQLCDSLSANTTLTELYASGHSMEPRTASVVADMLSSNTTLTHLCVGDSDFGSEALEALSRGVAASVSLRTLDLEHKGLDAVGMEPLGQAVRTSSSLRTLVLSRNQISDAGVAALCREGLAQLEELDLQECGLGQQACEALASGLERSPGALRRLWLNDNPLGGGVSMLAPLVRHQDGMRQLGLRNVGLGDAEAAALARALPPGSSLALLDLSDNSLTLQEGSPLPLPAGLQRLLLRGNKIGDAGVAALAASLPEACPDLRELDLGGNALGSGAVAALQRINVPKLGLFACNIGDEGMTQLAQLSAEGHLRAVEELDVAGCGAGMAGAQCLFDALAAGAMPALRVLLLGANPAVEDEGWEGALQRLRQARTELDVMWRTNDPSGTAPQ
mmetsp:Transcript_4803/g.12079  ORF Transcript_4803/g.12079 Transcript_4803/m.12079 type:complete len:428 (-) Transcript_4803:54-1337(-)